MHSSNYSNIIGNLMNMKSSELSNYAMGLFLEKDENFELALSLAYLTLSKEKIIEKDFKNNNRLSRLTSKVEESEIEKVFAPGFCPEMPNIIMAEETNKVWLLDDIRDSIMHGHSKFDMDNKVILINNTMFNRKLVAEIPFSWLIAYAKSDILNKRMADKYVVRNFYRNDYKKNYKYLNTKREIEENILYSVYVFGDTFNTSVIENRIKELFEKFSKDPIDQDESYTFNANDLKKYHVNYLTSFKNACKNVEAEMKKEFPNLNVQIYKSDRKHKLSNKLTKRLPGHFNNYDLMIDYFNSVISSKEKSLLNCISNILLNLDSESLNNVDDANILHKLIYGKDLIADKINDIYNARENDSNTLREICLSVYGISLLVINDSSIYSDDFLNMNPKEFKLNAYEKQPYMDYLIRKKKNIMDVLEKEIQLFSYSEQLSKCTNSEGKAKINNNINSLENEISSLCKDYDNYIRNFHYNIFFNTPEYEDEREKSHKLKSELDLLCGDFQVAPDVLSKKEIRKNIGLKLDEVIEEEMIYTYVECNTMKDALVIIRNSLAHVGRITVRDNKNFYKMVYFNDYDNDRKKSGMVVTEYNNLMKILSYLNNTIFKGNSMQK